MKIFILSVLFSLPLVAAPIDGSIRPANLPPGFDLVGLYSLSSKTKVRHGVSINLLTADVVYKVFSNGQLVRVYNSGAPKVFHVYEIYSSEGIGNPTTSGGTRISPGIQARNVQASMLKQLSVTPRDLTITQIPPLSDSVIILHAKRSVTSKSSNK